MKKLKWAIYLVFLMIWTRSAYPLDQPWISDVYFYWYEWDYEKELGSWMGGVHNTPLDGYYDSRTFRDNRRSLWQASEWGITHHFMDYWTPTWKDEHGQMREKTLVRAAESLRKDGYNIWMAYYQDGTNFEMKDFSKNVSEKRDVHQWLRDFANSPVWPRLNGYPFQLVYGRNGRPKTTEDHVGFRAFLRSKYPSIDALNKQWGTAFKSFDEIQMSFSAKGFQRAMSIKYQYDIWQKEWARLDELVKKEFDLPGVRVSFDVGYKPFLGFGYSDFARVFGGPHSYGGIFTAPHDQDAERFVQAAVAKKYNTIFFDHFKNYYHDWNIRTPGIVYWPNPFHFDRFWVGALMRRSEALLHLSWNEWWEGSNLEPCQEFGKIYPQKNLFYSTLMQLCFPSIRQSTAGAEVVVLLNDWCFLAGGGRPEDLYETLQALRRLNVTFDLLPDDFVTDDALKSAKLLIIPQCGTGLGLNAKDEPIADIIWRWLTSGKGRRLITSRNTRMRDWLGFPLSTPALQPSTPAPDLNVFVDVGDKGDEDFILEGASGPEDWRRVPKGNFGAESNYTVRWTPGQWDATVLRLPASPGREHVLRFAGSAIWPNQVRVFIEQKEVGLLPIEPGYKEYELKIPASAIAGARLIELLLLYKEAHVPSRVDPKRYPAETRVCNLALDWLQFATSNIPPKQKQQQFVMPKVEIEFIGDIFKGMSARRIVSPASRYDFLNAPSAEVLSRYVADGAPRDIVKKLGDNAVLYVNGLLSDISNAGWWKAVLAQWASLSVRPLVEPARPIAEDLNVMSARLSAGDTDIVLAANYDIAKKQEIVLALDTRSVPLSEVFALSRDGKTYQPLIGIGEGQRVRVTDSLQYYGVYAFVFAPVRVSTPAFVLQPGERREFPVTVKNLMTKPVSGTICPQAVIPTLTGTPCKVELGPAQEREFRLPLEAKDTSDWGVKTIALELNFEGRKAYLFRDVTILAPPNLQLSPRIVPAGESFIEIENRQHRLITSGDAEDVKVSIATLPIPLKTTSVGSISSGQKMRVGVNLPAVTSELPVVKSYQVGIEYKAGGQPRERIERPLLVANLPRDFEKLPGALAAIVVFNGRDCFADRALVRCDVKKVGLVDKKFSIRDTCGTAIPFQLEENGEVLFPVLIPPRSGQVFILCEDPSAAPSSDLRLREVELGTRKGRLTVSNSFFTITLDESRGGTVTEFRSATTGRDYGAQSLGVNYGKFGDYDPAQPCSNTSKFIAESKTHQSHSPAKISLVSKGPLLTVAKVEWSDRNISVTQTYEFGAYQRYVFLRQVVKPAPTLQAQEIVALDARFTPHALCKTYPNFVGLPPTKEPSPHYGWRYGNWIPDYLTIMEPKVFEESISIIPVRHAGLDQVRQGFWPSERPKPGPRAFAEIEFIAHKIGPIELDVYIGLHPGYQVAAKQFKEDIENPLLVVPVAAPQWRESSIKHLPAPRPDWADNFWHYRVPLNVGAVPATVSTAQVKIDLDNLVPGQKVEENSLRLIRHDPTANTWNYLPFIYDKHRGELWWRAEFGPRLYLYFDTVQNGPKPSYPQKTGPSGIRPDDPIRVPQDWSLGHAKLRPGEGHEGKDAICMLCPYDASHAIVSHHNIRVLPKTRYRLTLWARAVKEPVKIYANFYDGPAYDFPHKPISVSAGEQWQQYETELEAGDFPSDVYPAFRLWTTEKEKEVQLSGISLEPILPQYLLKAELGKLETICALR